MREYAVWSTARDCEGYREERYTCTKSHHCGRFGGRIGSSRGLSRVVERLMRGRGTSLVEPAVRESISTQYFVVV